MCAVHFHPQVASGVEDNMADSDQIAPLPFIETSNGHHRRVATASAELNSDRVPNQQARRPRSFSSIALAQQHLKLPESSHLGQNKKKIIRDRDWDSEENVNPDKIDGTVYERANLFEPGHKAKNIKARQKPGLVTLEYSKIHQKTTSPHYPESKLDLALLGPQPARPPHTRKDESLQPLSPTHDDLAEDMSAPGYAMDRYLEEKDEFEDNLQVPAPAQQDMSDHIPSALVPPARDDEISYTNSAHYAGTEEIYEDGIPEELRRMDPFQTRIRHIRLRTYLMRCSVLQSTIREIERKPWAQSSTKPPYWYYSKMRTLAQRARQLAEALMSNDLRARCEYWFGRGCGGTGDFEAASHHFEQAIKLDVANDYYPSGRLRLRGLRPVEKADVHFLFGSVKDSHTAWKAQTENARQHAQSESERTYQPIEECVDWSGLNSLDWVPDRDRVHQLAAQEHGVRSNQGADVPNPGDPERDRNVRESEETLQTRYAADGLDTTELTRRTFSAREWKYIKHGDVRAAERRRRQESDARRESRQPTSPGMPASPIVVRSDDNELHSPNSPHQQPGKTSARLTQPLSLADELNNEGLYSDYEEEELSPSSVSRTASPEARTPSDIDAELDSASRS